MSKIVQLKDQEGDSLYPKTMAGTGIRVYQSTGQSIAKTTTVTIIFDTTEYKTNNNLTLSNNQIVIGKGINYVLVNGRWSAPSGTGYGKYIYIFQNNDNKAFQMKKYDNTLETNVVLNVVEGDCITLKCYQENSAAITTSSEKTQTFLQVTVLG